MFQTQVLIYSIFMRKDKKIFIAGHKGMVGSCLLNRFKKKGFQNLITEDRSCLDLTNQLAVNDYFKKKLPDVVIIAAARVGGIGANSNDQLAFLYENLMIQNNIMLAAANSGSKKIIFLGSSCIYPRECEQPIKEEYLLNGPLEKTNEGYAIAKIAGLKLAKFISEKYGINCICPMPCNLYGTNDNFDLKTSHVLSALVRKFVDAVDERKENVTLWGSGRPKREFLHVEDAVTAIELLIDRYDSSNHINVGSGNEISIKELALLISNITGFRGGILWNSDMPDGTPRKILDNSKIKSLGFQPKISLEEGVKMTIKEYKYIKSYIK